MSYGKYGFKDTGNGKDLNLTDYKSMFYSDPGYAIGSALGDALFGIYFKNQTNKSIDKILGNNSITPTAKETQDAYNQVNAARNQSDYANLGVAPGDNAGLARIAQQNGVSTPQDRAVNAVSALNDPSNFQTGSAFDKYRLQDINKANSQNQSLADLGAIPQSKDDIGQRVLENYVGQVQPMYGLAPGEKYGNIDTNNYATTKYANGSYAPPNVTTTTTTDKDGKTVLIPTIDSTGNQLSNEDAIAQYNQTGQNFGTFDNADAAQQQANIISTNEKNRAKMAMGVTTGADVMSNLAAAKRLDNFNAKEIAQNARMDLAKSGYSQASIDYIMGIAEPQLQATQDKIYKAKADAIEQQLASVDFSKGYNQIALPLLNQLAKYDPVRAKEYASQMVNAPEAWKENMAQVRQFQQHKYQMESQNNAGKISQSLALLQNKLGMNKMEFEYYLKNKFAKQSLQDKMSLLVGAGLPPDEAARAVAGVGKGKTSGTSGSKSSIGTDAWNTYKMNAAIVKNAEAKKAADPNYQYTDIEQRAKAYTETFSNMATTGDPNGMNWSDWNTATKYVMKLLRHNYSQESVAKAVAANTDPGEYRNSMLDYAIKHYKEFSD